MEPPQQCHSVWQQWKVCTPRASLLFSPQNFFNPFTYIIYFYVFCSQHGYIWNQFHSGTYRLCRKKFAKQNDSSGEGGEREGGGLLNPILHDFRNSTAFCTSTLHQDDLPVTSTCWWRWVRNVFAMIRTGKNRSTRRKSYQLRFCPLQISCREAWDQTRPSAVSTKISSPNTTVYFSQKSLTCYG